jgi:hypothetical protein
MKKILAISLFAVVVMLCIPQQSEAQLQANPQDFNFFYFNWLTSSQRILLSTIDTLPRTTKNFWYSASPQYSNVGGASYLTLQIIVSDTCKADVYVDAKPTSGGAIVTILTDSLIVTSADAKEYILRTVKTNARETLDERYRVRFSIRSNAQGNNAADIYKIRWLWKP